MVVREEIKAQDDMFLAFLDGSARKCDESFKKCIKDISIKLKDIFSKNTNINSLTETEIQEILNNNYIDIKGSFHSFIRNTISKYIKSRNEALNKENNCCHSILKIGAEDLKNQIKDIKTSDNQNLFSNLIDINTEDIMNRLSLINNTEYFKDNYEQIKANVETVIRGNFSSIGSEITMEFIHGIDIILNKTMTRIMESQQMAGKVKGPLSIPYRLAVISQNQ